MSILNSAAGFISRLGQSIKSTAKIVIESRRCTLQPVATEADTLIIMGNGPSLADTIARDSDTLKRNHLMAVNFAANTEEFYALRPDYYIMIDPVFFAADGNVNVERLRSNLLERVDWPMTLIIPARMKTAAGFSANPRLTVRCINPVGVDGFRRLRDTAYGSGRGMPRPRNVLIAALMAGIRLGYKTIYITGADHSWTRTLEVSENNEVISVQPHFYKDNAAEHARVASVYRNVRMHDIMLSFSIAFRSYFMIEDYARRHGITIYNATPGSFIDAFPRRRLSDNQG